MKCQVVAIWEGGIERGENVLMKWKDNGAITKDVEGPATHPLNRDRFESEMTECVHKWYVDVTVIGGEG